MIGPGADALLVAGASVAGAEFQVDARVLHEGLVAEVPSERNGGEPAPAVLGGEFRRTVRAQCRGEHVTVFVAGGDTSEIGLHRVFVERSGDVVEFRRCIDDVERRRGESAHVDVILLAGHILIGVAQHGTEIDVAELVVIVGVDLERGVGHVAVSLHQTSHARTVGMVLVIVGIVVGEAQVGVVVGLNLQFVVEKVELGEEIAQDAVILDIGDLLVEDLHGVVERELGSAAGVISPPRCIDMVDRALVNQAFQDRRADVGAGNLVVLHIIARNVGAHLQPFGEFLRHFGLEVRLAHGVGADDAGLVVIASAHVIGGLGVASRHGDIDVVAPAQLRADLHPVGVGHRAEGVLNVDLVVCVPDLITVLAVVVVDAFVIGFDILF